MFIRFFFLCLYGSFVLVVPGCLQPPQEAGCCFLWNKPSQTSSPLGSFTKEKDTSQNVLEALGVPSFSMPWDEEGYRWYYVCQKIQPSSVSRALLVDNKIGVFCFSPQGLLKDMHITSSVSSQKVVSSRCTTTEMGYFRRSLKKSFKKYLNKEEQSANQE